MSIVLGSALAGLLMLGQAGAADLKIGIMVPITYSETTAGKDMEKSIKPAVDEINTC